MILPAGALPGAAVHKVYVHLRRLTRDESTSVGQTDLREVQDHQAQGPRYGYLRESPAQTETGLIRSVNRFVKNGPSNQEINRHRAAASSANGMPSRSMTCA